MFELESEEIKELIKIERDALKITNGKNKMKTKRNIPSLRSKNY